MGSWSGFFISIEGVESVGKSTQAAALAVTLGSVGREVLSVREPGDTRLGELVRSYLLQHCGDGSADPWSEVFLFMAARVQLLRERIIPALADGVVVVADRYVDSLLAYQGGGRGIAQDELRALHRRACADLWPDLTVLLDVPRDVALGRQRIQELPLDRIERAPESFHAAVHDAFQAIADAEGERVVRIDANRSASEVSADVWEVVRQRLPSGSGHHES